MREALQCVLLFLLSALFSLKSTAQTVVLDPSVWNSDFTFPYRNYGSGVSFFDVNNDGFDDVTFPQKNDSIILFLSNGQSFEPQELMYIHGEAKQPIWVDFDNDGDYDLFVSVYAGQSRLFRNEGDFQFTDVTMPFGLIETNGFLCYGASWGDYNSDGWLDLYLNVYDYGTGVGNFLFRNNGGINFSNVTATTGATIASDYSFQSTMIDWDYDGDIDIHVANDRAPRDGYYTNQGPFFTNDYSSAGLDLVSNSMSSSWSDFDHDGDMDFYVTNTPALTNDFWRKNPQGFYGNIAEDLNLGMSRWCWGALWVDINNNTWEDLYVCNQANPDDAPPFFINHSGTSFEQMNIVENPSSVDADWAFSPAKGDFNGDGFYDIAINAYDGAQPKFYRNTTEENKWVKVKLRGLISNRDGAGTRIEYFVDGNKLIRHHLIGTNFMGQDSQWLILGLGEATQIDSLHCYWPSGIVSSYFNIPAQTITVLSEGEEFVPLFGNDESPISSLFLQICEGSSIDIHTSGFESYLWSDGTEGSSITITEPGEYYVVTTNELGIENASSTFEVAFVSDAFEDLSFQDATCFGQNNGSIELNGNAGWSYLIWLNNQPVIQWNQLQSGAYLVQAIHELECTKDSLLTIQQPEEISFNLLVQQPLCFGESNGSIEVIELSGGSGNFGTSLYNALGDLINPDMWQSLPAGNYVFAVADDNGCENSQVVAITSPLELVLTVEENQNGAFQVSVAGGTPPYQIAWNGTSIPNNHTGTFTEEVNSFEIIDSNGCLVEESVVFVGTYAHNESKHFIQNLNGNIFCFPTSVENIELLDMAGRSIKYMTNVNAISIADMTVGTYLIKVGWKDGEVLMFKFISNNQTK